MAVTYVGGYKGAAVGSSGASFSLPAGAVEGDLLIFVLVTPGTVSAVPSGWALQEAGQRTRVYTKYAGASEPGISTWNLTADADLAHISLAYRGPDLLVDSSATATSGTTITAPSVVSTKADTVLLAIFGAVPSVASSALTTPAGMTSRQYQTGSTYSTALVADVTLAATGATGDRTSTSSASLQVSAPGDGILLALGANAAPNAPILDVPSTVDRNVTNRFNLTPSDPDPGDTTSQTDWRYREIGAPTWTTVTKTSPTTYYDFAAGTFLGADYEIQARTYDAAGLVGPWSPSSFFTANDAPDQPTWTDPLNGQTIGTASYAGTISAPDVDESEWRLVADNAGVIDEATVLHGPVLKTTGDVRSHTFSGLTNGVTVWWQARTKFGGLWSQWAAVRTPVAYTPPPAPTLTPAASNADGAVSVTVSTPTPGAGEPTVEYVDLYVRDTTGTDTYRPATGIRWAMFRVPNGVTVDWLAASGINYEYQAVAHGDNGTTAASAWTLIDPDAVADIYFGGSFD